MTVSIFQRGQYVRTGFVLQRAPATVHLLSVRRRHDHAHGAALLRWDEAFHTQPLPAEPAVGVVVLPSVGDDLVQGQDNRGRCGERDEVAEIAPRTGPDLLRQPHLRLAPIARVPSASPVPDIYSPRKTLYNRSVRWATKGVWTDIVYALASAGSSPTQLLID